MTQTAFGFAGRQRSLPAAVAVTRPLPGVCGQCKDEILPQDRSICDHCRQPLCGECRVWFYNQEFPEFARHYLCERCHTRATSKRCSDLPVLTEKDIPF